MMVSAQMNLVRQCVGIIGNFIALCLFLSPTPTFIRIVKKKSVEAYSPITFIRIVKKKSVEAYSPIPYLATLINCLVWVLYGLPMVNPHSTLVLTINGTGVLIEVVFITIFFVFCRCPKQRLVIAIVLTIEAIFMAILALLVFTLQHTTKKRRMSIGIVCCVFNAMMYASPLSVMKMVITTKSVEFMPFWLSLAGFLNAGVWTIYALVPFDLYIAIPNGVGCAFGLAQLILYGAYYKSTKRIMAERQKQPNYIVEVALSGGVSHTEPAKMENLNQQRNDV